jgi:purine-binding chemotaxis protein CheW
VGEVSLVLRAGAHLCGLGVAQVIETMRPLPVRPLAGVPAFVAGVSVIRGEPVPVVDLAALLGGDREAPGRDVTVRGGRSPVALAVGRVFGVRAIPEGSWHELPRLLDAVHERSELIEALCESDVQPLFVLRGARVVPAEVWAALETDVAD